MITKVLDVQRRGQQIGRLRIGQTLISQKGKPYPSRLETFRFTTGSRFVAEQVAVLYGGQVKDWEGHKGQYEVITTEASIFVTIPPRDGMVSQAYEMWTGGGAVRRCDSQNEQISGGRCLCPHAEDPADQDEVAAAALQRSGLAAMNPPRACKLVTRISVMIPDLPGLGVWRLDTHSFYAAVEIGDQAELLERARDSGVFLRAMLRIDQRQRIAGGETKKYPVPVLEILDSFRDLVTGAIEARGLAGQLPPAPGQPVLALPAGPSALPAGPPPAPEPSVPLGSQEIADLVVTVTDRKELDRLAAMAKEQRCGDDLISFQWPGSELVEFEDLGKLINIRWTQLRDGQSQPA